MGVVLPLVCVAVIFPGPADQRTIQHVNVGFSGGHLLTRARRRGIGTRAETRTDILSRLFLLKGLHYMYLILFGWLFLVPDRTHIAFQENDKDQSDCRYLTRLFNFDPSIVKIPM